MTHLLNQLGHFPMSGGAARMSSAVRECHDLSDFDAEELTSQLFDAPTVQVPTTRMSQVFILGFVSLTPVSLAVLRAQRLVAADFHRDCSSGETIDQTSTANLVLNRFHSLISDHFLAVERDWRRHGGRSEQRLHDDSSGHS